MRRLRKKLGDTKRQAFAEGTSSNILLQWKTYRKFCFRFDINEWPTSINTLCLFAQYLAKKFRSVKTIESYLCGVKKLHQYAGIDPPDLKSFELQLTLRGLRRKLKHKVRRVKAMTPNLLLRIHPLLNLNTDLHIVLWTSFLTAFFLLLRKSNLVPNAQHSFNSKRQLTRKQVQIKKDRVLIKIYWSKTIQFHQRSLKLVLWQIPGSVLCPVAAFQQMFSIVKAGPKDPCFRLRNRKPLSYNMMNYYLKKFLRLAGVKRAAKFSAHSFRRGGLTFGHQIGIDRDLLKIYGDWKSNSYEAYLSFPTQTRQQVAKKFRDEIERRFA